MPAASSAPPMKSQPVERDADPAEDREPAEDRDHDTAPDPAGDDRRRLLREPAPPDDLRLERLVERRDRRAELQEVVGLDVALVVVRHGLQAGLGELLRRAERPGVVPPLAGERVGIRVGWPGLDADLAADAQQPVLLAERDPAAAREVEHRGGQRPARRLAGEDEDARGRRQRLGWAGHQDRRVVEVDRVAAEAQPRPDGGAGEDDEQERGDEEAEDRVELACPLQGRGVLRRRGRIDLRHRREQRAVEVAAAEERQHVLVEDLLLLGVVEERRPEARAAVQDHLPVLVARVHVEQDHEAVVEALPPDAPLVHQRPGVGVGLLGRPAVLDGLGVDHDLGAVRCSIWRIVSRDAIDGVRAEDAGGVVDADAVLRLGEGRSRGERRQQPAPGGRQRRTRRRRRRGRRQGESRRSAMGRA